MVVVEEFVRDLGVGCDSICESLTGGEQSTTELCNDTSIHWSWTVVTRVHREDQSREQERDLVHHVKCVTTRMLQQVCELSKTYGECMVC